MYKHLSFEQRLTIESMLNDNFSVKEIADKLNVSASTIYREIKRGDFQKNYSPACSELKYREHLKSKGKESVIENNQELNSYISLLIIEKHLTPRQIASHLKECEKFKNYTVSHTTIYKAIENGLIKGVSKETLRRNTLSVYNNGTITLPKHILEKMNIKDGEKLNFEFNENGELLLSKVVQEKT